MALQPCLECGAQISEKAASCPQCGAPPNKPQEEKPNYFLRVLGGIVFAVVGLMVLGFIIGSSPEAEARGKDRYAIEYCWKEQKRQSLAPSEARFIAGACEKLEADFRAKYGSEP